MSDGDESTSIRTYLIAGGAVALASGVVGYLCLRYQRNHFTGVGKKTLEDGSVYEGELVNGMACGMGTAREEVSFHQL